MARLENLPQVEQAVLKSLPCPEFAKSPWVSGPPLSQRRVAIVSTAGLHRRDDRPFSFTPGDHYRIIPGDIEPNQLVLSHVSANFDRTGFALDWNVMFPLGLLRELAADGIIGGTADFHYSFMGATDPVEMEQSARSIASAMKKEKVDAVLLVPV